MKMIRVWKQAIQSLTDAGGKRARGRASEETVMVVFTQYQVIPSCLPGFEEALRIYIISSLRSRGNIMAEAYHEPGDPSTLWTIERWSNGQAYKNNRSNRAAKLVDALTKVGLSSPVETFFVKDLMLLAKEAGRPPAGRDQSLTILLFVEVKAGTEDHFRSINQDVLLVFRQEPAVLFFQLGQVLNNSTHFVVLKKFCDRAAFQHHLKDPALGPVMKFLQTSVKEPPFERGYHQLVAFAPVYRGL